MSSAFFSDLFPSQLNKLLESDENSPLKPTFRVCFQISQKGKIQKMTLNYLERFQKLRKLRENMKKVELNSLTTSIKLIFLRKENPFFNMSILTLWKCLENFYFYCWPKIDFLLGKIWIIFKTTIGRYFSEPLLNCVVITARSRCNSWWCSSGETFL